MVQKKLKIEKKLRNNETGQKGEFLTKKDQKLYTPTFLQRQKRKTYHVAKHIKSQKGS